MADKSVQDTSDYQDRAEKIMPTWSEWGGGVVMIKKEQWYKSRARIISILRQLHRAKITRKRIPNENRKKKT